MDTIKWFNRRVESLMESRWRTNQGMFTPEVLRLLSVTRRLEARLFRGQKARITKEIEKKGATNERD